LRIAFCRGVRVGRAASSSSEGDVVEEEEEAIHLALFLRRWVLMVVEGVCASPGWRWERLFDEIVGPDGLKSNSNRRCFPLTRRTIPLLSSPLDFHPPFLPLVAISQTHPPYRRSLPPTHPLLSRLLPFTPASKASPSSVMLFTSLLASSLLLLASPLALVRAGTVSPTHFVIETPSKQSPWKLDSPNPLVWKTAQGAFRAFVTRLG
jgi:hypothetical protein